MIGSARPLTPMLIAALLGGGVAFVTMRMPSSKAPPPQKSSSPSTRATAARRPAPAQPATIRPLATESAASAATTVAPTPPAAPSVSAGAEGRARSPVGFDTSALLSPPSTPDELLGLELDCDRKKLPEACERVAISLESGSAGTKDATRASKLRRIALTLYVKQCETDRAFSCKRLAEMYDDGEIVQKNPKNAEALRTRTLELCRARPSQLGCAASK